jgi:PAS domain S-box-containing protein
MTETPLQEPQVGGALRHEVLVAVLDSMSEGVSIINERGEHLLRNLAATRILGVDSTGTTPDQWQEHFGVFRPDGHTPFPADEMPLIRALRGVVSADVEMVVRNAARPEGVWINVSARPLDPRFGRGGAVAVFYDVTERKRAAEARQLTEERLQLLLDGARDHAILMLDPQGRVRSWSASAQRMKGWQESEILGRGYDTFFTQPDVDRGEPRRMLDKAAGEGRCELEGPRVRKDGSTFWVHGVLTAIRDAEGRLIGFVKVAQDITERRRAEAKFRGMLEAAPDAMLGIDRQGRICMVNTRAEEMFQYHRDDLLGQPVEILVPEAYRDVHVRHRRGYQDNPQPGPMVQGRDLRARRKDGYLFPVEVTLSTLDTEDGAVVCAAVRDISERQAAQRSIESLNLQLLALNEGLERRVAERTAQLQAQAEQLWVANAELESFSYSVSHDLRAPLRSIAGFARIFATQYGPGLDDAARRYLDRIETGAVQMGQLIDGLLAFARLQRLEMTSQILELAPLVRDVWDTLAEARQERTVELRCPDLPAVYGDPRLIRHVLANLLENAIKYTRKQPMGQVEVGYQEVTGSEVTLFVRDNGTGFDMQYAGKLFQVFQRLHRVDEFEGTGIGLALVARIIRRHGGRIWAVAAPDKGATFYFTLPTTPNS